MARTRRNDPESASASPALGSRERLVLAAHQLIGEAGLAGFKVLDVASRAGANVALINYHFGGRDGLLDEVVHRVVEQIAADRTARLDALMARCGDDLPDVRQLLHCWLDPWLANIEHEDNREVMMLMLHLMFASDVPGERKEQLLARSASITSRFVTVLCRCYPAVTREQMTWRMLCAIGASYLVLGQRRPVGWDALAAGAAKAPKVDRHNAVDELAGFILGGFAAAPTPAPTRSSKRRVRRS